MLEGRLARGQPALRTPKGMAFMVLVRWGGLVTLEMSFERLSAVK